MQSVSVASAPDRQTYRIVLTDGTEMLATEDNPKATDLVLAALATCSVRTLATVLSRMRIQIEGVELVTTAERAETVPKVFTSVLMDWTIHGGATPKDRIMQALGLSEKYCPVYNMLVKAVPIEVKCQVISGDPSTES